MRPSRFFACILALWAMPDAASGCSIPVFRYALERWPCDPYEAIVFHDGTLSQDQQDLLKGLEDSEESGDHAANLMVMAVDLREQIDEGLQAIWDEQDDPKLPWMVVLFPYAYRIPVPAWRGPFTQENVDQLLDSGARSEISKRLVAGQSAVWIFLETGDPEKDDEACQRLSEHLEAAKENLELPAAEDWGPPFYEGPMPLRMEFSTVRVSRKDPQERILADMLLQTEEGLSEFDEPMAFPVYGRGRSLYALVGKGINEENVVDTCGFLVGPCLCQVKGACPGMDLLVNLNWDEALYEQMSNEEVPGDFSGLPQPGASSGTSSGTAARVGAKNATAPEGDGGGFHRRGALFVALLLVFVGGGLGSLLVKVRR